MVADTGIQNYYNISNKTKGQIEYEANKEAIKLLILHYNEEYSINHSTSTQQIISMYDIPQDLDFMVQKELEKCYFKKGVLKMKGI
ncbi:hypothetical protein [Enterococcus sp. UD-01]|jgi:hypothetical protein|uniref:hypothetical protein n=1 Tax=Enterococcus sp. UD-01 TaxID=3373911 RepID=UPI003832DD86